MDLCNPALLVCLPTGGAINKWPDAASGPDLALPFPHNLNAWELETENARSRSCSLTCAVPAQQLVAPNECQAVRLSRPTTVRGGRCDRVFGSFDHKDTVTPLGSSPSCNGPCRAWRVARSHTHATTKVTPTSRHL